MTIEAKTCKNCGLTKDLSDFRKDPNNKSDGHRGTCKSCETIKRDMKRAMKVDEWESDESLKERIRPMLQGLTNKGDEEGATASSERVTGFEGLTLDQTFDVLWNRADVPNHQAVLTEEDFLSMPPPPPPTEEELRRFGGRSATEEELNQLLRSNPLADLTNEELQQLQQSGERLPLPTYEDLMTYEKRVTTNKKKGARPSRERFNMRWNPEEIKELEQFSEKQDLSMSQTVRRAVRYYLAEVERLGHLP